MDFLLFLLLLFEIICSDDLESVPVFRVKNLGVRSWFKILCIPLCGFSDLKATVSLRLCLSSFAWTELSAKSAVINHRA